MIIITDRPGQLCNRLWAITPFVALSLKHDIKLHVVCFDSYDKYFEDLKLYNQIKINRLTSICLYNAYKYILRNNHLEKLQKKMVVIEEKFNDYNELYSQLTRKEKCFFIKSWAQPFDIDLIQDYKSDIVRLFKPKECTRKYVDHFFAQQVEPKEVVVGVHVRKKDYRSYRNGKYYYSDTIYKEKMLKVQKELQERDKIPVFLLCSDASIDADNFSGLNTLTLEHSTAINDLYALSRCNYIMGPPSTFSMWASFCGDVPLRFVTSERHDVILSEFSPVITQNRFRNGCQFEHS